VKSVVKLLVAGVAQPCLLGGLLFLSAGTVDYWQAWVLLLVLFGFSGWLPSVYLLVKDPEALERRMRGGPAAETRPAQKVAMAVFWPSLFAMLVFSALDHRFGWSSLATEISLVGAVLVALGSALVTLVMFQNTYAATTVHIEDSQKVVATGVYGLVRHPMYTGYLITILGIPLTLGSFWGLAFLIPCVVAVEIRIRDEEQLLEHELDGYLAYMQKVPCRLLPLRREHREHGRAPFALDT
jgi:protein-S-isoprenylcysteine O-methyltransferase Ste14